MKHILWSQKSYSASLCLSFQICKREGKLAYLIGEGGEGDLVLVYSHISHSLPIWVQGQDSASGSKAIIFMTLST